MTLEDEVTLSQRDAAARERLIEQNMDFIRRCASRAAGRFVDSHDDACSEAMIAFNDAISAYQPERGAFLPICRCSYPQPDDRSPAAGKPAVSLTPGTVITIPPEVRHWHGAKADSWFSHIAVEVPGENTSNEWCEPVTDEEYAKLK